METSQVNRMGMVPSTPLASILNFRDVGETVNHISPLYSSSSSFSAYPRLAPRVLYRSARPDDASLSDREALKQTYSIRTIIDLRSTTEHIDQARKHSAQIFGSAMAFKKDNKAAKAIEIEGINYREISLTGGSFARALLWRLKWSSFSKFIGLMALGYRIEAIAILGREVMAPRGLIGLGIDTLDYSTSEIKAIFAVFAESQCYPVLVHCTQGKDRTGLVITLLLLFLKLPRDVISADYMASERELESQKVMRIKESTQIGLGENFAGCPVDFVEQIAGHLKQVYGSVEAYMKKIGIDEATQSRIRHNLLDEGDISSKIRFE